MKGLLSFVMILVGTLYGGEELNKNNRHIIQLPIVSVPKYAYKPPRITLYDPILKEELRGPFNDINEAAVRAEIAAHQLTDKFESAGMILQGPNKKFYFTNPLSVGEIDESHPGIERQMTLLPDYTKVANYHTHPCRPYTYYIYEFSEADTMNASRAKLIAYMMEMCNGNVLKFDPGLESMGDGIMTQDGARLTLGEVIGRVTLIPHVWDTEDSDNKLGGPGVEGIDPLNFKP